MALPGSAGDGEDREDQRACGTRNGAAVRANRRDSKDGPSMRTAGMGHLCFARYGLYGAEVLDVAVGA
jgi:hypothetical protein